MNSKYDQLTKKHTELHKSHLKKMAESKKDSAVLQAKLAELKRTMEPPKHVEGEDNLIQKELFQAQSSVAKLNSELIDLQTKLDQANERESKAESEAELASDNARQLRDQISDLESQLLQSKEESGKFEAQESELKQNLIEANATLSDVRTELEFSKAKTVESKQSLEAEVKRFKSSVAGLSQEKEGLSATIESLRAEQSKFTEQLAQQSEEHAVESREVQRLQAEIDGCLLYTSPSPRDRTRSRMPSSA